MEDARFRLMRLLQDNPDRTQRELANDVGLSVGAVNYCLRALAGKGLLKMHNFAHSKNKFGYVYVLTPAGIAEKSRLTQRFLERKVAEFRALEAEIRALRGSIGVEEPTASAADAAQGATAVLGPGAGIRAGAGSSDGK